MKIDSAHNWAYGCIKCTCGVRDEHHASPTGAVELVLERLVAAERVGPAYFCDCQAGEHLRAHLLAVRERYAKRMQRYEGQDVAIGNVILSAARVAMQQPHMQFAGKREGEKATP